MTFAAFSSFISQLSLNVCILLKVKKLLLFFLLSPFTPTSEAQ